MRIRTAAMVIEVCLRLSAAEPPALPEIDLSSIQAPYRKLVEQALAQAQTGMNDADAVSELCNTLLAVNQAEDAASCYRRARALDSGEFRWGYYLAVALEQVGRRPEAVELLLEIKSAAGSYAPYYVRLGDLLREQGRTKESETELDRAVEMQPDFASAHLALGKLQSEQERWTDAISSLEKAVALDTNYAAARYALGLAYRKTGETEKAKLAFERYQRLKQTEQPSFDPLMDAISALRSESGLDDTRALTPDQKRVFVEELERSLAVHPELLSAHVNLIALYFQLGDPAKAKQHYDKAISIDPKSAGAHYNWGSIEMTKGNYAAAEKAYALALESYPRHVGALVRSGLLLEKRGLGDEAEQRYRAALEANPMQRQAHYLLARRLVGEGDFAGAAQHLEETVRIEDELTPRYLRALASTYLRMGRLEQARSSLEQAEQQARTLGHEDVASAARADMERLPQ
ncbi:MAG: tetratricopeptide repeat protein [Acidobacteria bacterium]|nr:tetratricopeptide repeat protein [Acidobacteriota bacterium]